MIILSQSHTLSLFDFLPNHHLTVPAAAGPAGTDTNALVVICSQQREIDRLRAEVNALRHQVECLMQGNTGNKGEGAESTVVVEVPPRNNRNSSSSKMIVTDPVNAAVAISDAICGAAAGYTVPTLLQSEHLDNNSCSSNNNSGSSSADAANKQAASFSVVPALITGNKNSDDQSDYSERSGSTSSTDRDSNNNTTLPFNRRHLTTTAVASDSVAGVTSHVAKEKENDTDTLLDTVPARTANTDPSTTKDSAQSAAVGKIDPALSPLMPPPPSYHRTAASSTYNNSDSGGGPGAHNSRYHSSSSSRSSSMIHSASRPAATPHRPHLLQEEEEPSSVFESPVSHIHACIISSAVCLLLRDLNCSTLRFSTCTCSDTVNSTNTSAVSALKSGVILRNALVYITSVS